MLPSPKSVLDSSDSVPNRSIKVFSLVALILPTVQE